MDTQLTAIYSGSALDTARAAVSICSRLSPWEEGSPHGRAEPAIVCDKRTAL